MQPLALDRTTEVLGRTVRHGVLGDGPDVVLCHGTPWSSSLWGDVAHDLARDHRVHVWDMPGFGASSKDPAHAVTLASQGEVLAELLVGWRLDAPHVIAHDVGGAVALRAHLVHGVPFASLALVDVVAERPWGSDLFRLVGRPRAPHRSGDPARDPRDDPRRRPPRAPRSPRCARAAPAHVARATTRVGCHA